MDHTEYRQPAVCLSNDSATNRLRPMVELHMSSTRISKSPGRQRGQHGGFVPFADTKDYPPGFLLPASPSLMGSVLVEQCSTCPVGQHNAGQRPVFRAGRA
jgi:hypothetical protein